MEAIPVWMRDEVGQGMLRVAVLALPGTPPTDGVVACAVMWCEALLALPITWREDADQWRVREAFRALLPTLDRWPAPKHLIDIMPRRRVVALPEPEMDREAARNEARAALAVIYAALEVNHG